MPQSLWCRLRPRNKPRASAGGRTGAFGPGSRIWSFNLRLMRAGAALLVCFEIVYFILDSYISPPLTPATTMLHVCAVAITALALALTTSKWFERYWRPVCFANLFAIYGLTLALILLTGDPEQLFITVVSRLIGAERYCDGRARWQAALSVSASGDDINASIDTCIGWSRDSLPMAGVLIAAALGHFILADARAAPSRTGWMDGTVCAPAIRSWPTRSRRARR